jgi:hypothetical protein
MGFPKGRLVRGKGLRNAHLLLRSYDQQASDHRSFGSSNLQRSRIELINPIWLAIALLTECIGVACGSSVAGEISCLPSSKASKKYLV